MHHAWIPAAHPVARLTVRPDPPRRPCVSQPRSRRRVENVVLTDHDVRQPSGWLATGRSRGSCICAGNSATRWCWPPIRCTTTASMSAATRAAATAGTRVETLDGPPPSRRRRTVGVGLRSRSVLSGSGATCRRHDVRSARCSGGIPSTWYSARSHPPPMVARMSTDLGQRSVDKIVRLPGRPRDLASDWRECTEVLSAVVPHYWTPCWYTLDPAALLATRHFHEGMAEFPAECPANECYGNNVNQTASVAISPSGISTLHEATGGDPCRSPTVVVQPGDGQRPRQRPTADPVRAGMEHARALSRTGPPDVR